MKNEILNFYTSLRQIFTICPSCNELHRISDCKFFQKVKPDVDWKEELDAEIKRLELVERKLQEKIEAGREVARRAGRLNAFNTIKKIDPVFFPLGLDCNDCKVIFHPVDFVVFNGMNNREGDCAIKEILLLDKQKKSGEPLAIQKSIEKVVKTKSYEWLTLRVNNEGQISEE